MKGTIPGDLALSVHRRADGAAETLVRSFQDQLFSFALRLLGNSFDAQEVTQDAFLHAIKALALQYDAERCKNLALRPWLFRITRNLASNKRRSRRTLREEPLEPESDSHRTALNAAIAPAPNLRGERELERLDRAVQLLDVQSREIVLLRFMEGLAYRDIADIIGSTEASARARLFRVLRKLRDILARMENNDAL